MTCEQFEAIVHDLKRPGALDEATYTLALFHTQTCDLCAARLAQARSLTAGLRAFEASEKGDGAAPGVEAPPRVEAMLRSAFLRNQWQMARAKSMRRWTAIGIAAALLLTAGLVSRYGRKSPALVEIARTTAKIPPQQVSSPVGPVAADPSRGSGHAVRENQAGSARDEDDFAADFVPYPSGGSILPFEGGQIVRVNLPGSALVAMGFPLDGDRTGDRFTADVLVGEDGLPRAIRFPR